MADPNLMPKVKIQLNDANNSPLNMKQNIALLAIMTLILTACATQPVASPPVVHPTGNSNAQAQASPAQANRPPPVLYSYEQRSWPQSAPTHAWKGYVPTGYQPPPNNAFDAAPPYAGGYGCPYAGGCCAPGAGLSVGFGIGSCSVGVGPCGLSAGIALGCAPIGVGFGVGCN